MSMEGVDFLRRHDISTSGERGCRVVECIQDAEGMCPRRQQLLLANHLTIATRVKPQAQGSRPVLCTSVHDFCAATTY